MGYSAWEYSNKPLTAVHPSSNYPASGGYFLQPREYAALLVLPSDIFPILESIVVEKVRTSAAVLRVEFRRTS